MLMRKNPSAAERARWLAEVAQALDQAQAVVERLSTTAGDSRQRAELLHRIEGARHMTRALRLSSDRRMSRPIAPN
jgi:hypothetical protein